MEIQERLNQIQQEGLRRIRLSHRTGEISDRAGRRLPLWELVKLLPLGPDFTVRAMLDRHNAALRVKLWLLDTGRT